MIVCFTGMVGADVALNVIQSGAGIVVETADDKPCLEVERSGQVTRDLILTESLVRRYVAFSGRNFGSPGFSVGSYSYKNNKMEV